MPYSTLKRKAPLKAKTPLKRHTPLKNTSDKSVGNKGDKRLSERRKSTQNGIYAQKHDLRDRLDGVFSLYIRLRDAMYGGSTKCISCGRILSFAQMQCGHYIGRANLATRWDERNCNSECAFCNCHDTSHLDRYKPNLIRKIGQEAFDNLQEDAREVRHFSEEEIKAMIEHYTRLARQMSKDKGIPVRI